MEPLQKREITQKNKTSTKTVLLHCQEPLVVAAHAPRDYRRPQSAMYFEEVGQFSRRQVITNSHGRQRYNPSLPPQFPWRELIQLTTSIYASRHEILGAPPRSLRGSASDTMTGVDTARPCTTTPFLDGLLGGDCSSLAMVTAGGLGCQRYFYFSDATQL